MAPFFTPPPAVKTELKYAPPLAHDTHSPTYRIREDDLAVPHPDDDAVFVFHLDELGTDLLHLVHEHHLRLGRVRVELEPVGVQLRVPHLPVGRPRAAELLDVAVEDAVGFFLVEVEELLLLGFLLVLDFVRLEVDGLEDGLGDFVLPPLGDDQREVLVELLVGVGQLGKNSLRKRTKEKSIGGGTKT